MECGIVGLPGCGKTSLFNALTGSRASLTGGAAKPHVGVAAIPDPRLELLARHAESRKITPAGITFVDIPGIGPGGGAAKTGPLLYHIRQVDAVCEVVRCYGGASAADARRDIRALQDELVLADLALAESALDRARRPARTGEAVARARVVVLEKVTAALGEGRPARALQGWSEAEAVILRGYGLVSAKRVLYVANVSEDDLSGKSEAAAAVRAHAAGSGGEAIAVCAKLEAELAELEGADRRELLEGLGLPEPAIGPLARAVCRLLGLVVFYTAGDKEARAWTVAEPATAPDAAGVIHSDMERGFIRAECYGINELFELGSEKAVRAAGRLRTEGKTYHIRDGDVIRVLFSA